MQNNNFKNLIPIIFDRKKIIPKNIKKKHIYENISIEIGERLKETNFNYKDTLEINSKINETEYIIKNSGKIKNLYKTSLTKNNYLKNIDVICDEELIPFKNNSFNLIFSILGLNIVNDLPGVLKQIYNSLKHNGLFIAAFWGQGTIAPLSESLAYADEKILGGLYSRTYPFCDIKTLGNLMQRAGFNDSLADLEKIIFKYKNIKDLLIDIRELGEKNILTSRKKTFTPKSIFKEAENFLIKKYSNNSNFSMPFNIIFVSGWKK
tara:strand:- start:3298 stop:4089 length:792 start_codon:yes stop_codon:yes gene_type:complete